MVVFLLVSPIKPTKSVASKRQTYLPCSFDIILVENEFGQFQLGSYLGHQGPWRERGEADLRNASITWGFCE